MREVSAKDVELLLEEGKPLNIVDVREDYEVWEGKIPGAVHIPLGQVEERMSELEIEKEYILVCRSGGRSGRAVQFLESNGYNVINMAGGMLSWEGPVE